MAPFAAISPIGFSVPRTFDMPGHRDELRPRGKYTVEGGQIEPAVGGQRNEPQRGPPFARHLLPGDEIRVMLHFIEEQFVPSLEETSVPSRPRRD
jgi:hypothetical protein